MLVTNRSISYFDDGDFSNSCVWRPTLLALHVKVKKRQEKGVSCYVPRKIRIKNLTFRCRGIVSHPLQYQSRGHIKRNNIIMNNHNHHNGTKNQGHGNDSGGANNRGRKQQARSPKRQNKNSKSPKRNQQKNNSHSPKRGQYGNKSRSPMRRVVNRNKKPAAMTVIVNRCDLWDSAAHFQPDECFQPQIHHTVARALPYKFESSATALAGQSLAPPGMEKQEETRLMSVATARVPHHVEAIQFPIRTEGQYHCDVIDTTIPNPHDPEVVHDKYWAQRR